MSGTRYFKLADSRNPEGCKSIIEVGRIGHGTVNTVNVPYGLTTSGYVGKNDRSEEVYRLREPGPRAVATLRIDTAHELNWDPAKDTVVSEIDADTAERIQSGARVGGGTPA